MKAETRQQAETTPREEHQTPVPPHELAPNSSQLDAAPASNSEAAVEADADGTVATNPAVVDGSSLLISPVPPRPALSPPLARAKQLAAALPRVAIDDRAGRILLSGLLALLLWFYVVNLENPPRTTVFNQVAVEVRGAREDMKLINTLPRVDITVQAPENLMSSLRQSDIRPYVDISPLDAGVHDVPVRAELTRDLQGGAVEVALRPSQLQVQLEIQVRRTVTLEVQPSGTPAFGYGLEAPQVEPREVQVTGSRDQVDLIARVVVPVDVENKAGTQRGFIPPVALDANGQEIQGLTFDPPTVTVVIPIKLLIGAKVVPVRVPLEGQPAPGYRVSAINVDPTNVNLCCAPDVLEPIQFLEAAPVTVAGVTSTLVTSTELILPPGVELYGEQSRTVNVTVSIEPLVTTFQLSVAPTVEGVPQNWSAVVSPDQVEVTLSGTFAQIQNITPIDVRARVSVAGRGPGTYELVPQITVPDGFKVERSSPGAVTVTLLPPTPVPPTSTPSPEPSPTAVITPTAQAGDGVTITATVPLTRTAPPVGTPAPTLTPRSTPAAGDGAPGSPATP